MSGPAVFWMIVFGFSTTMFLFVSVLVAVMGWQDLKDLLQKEDEP